MDQYAVLLQENFNKTYEYLDEIGRGKFAVVKKCRHRETGELFAAKVYNRRAGRRGERAKALKNEISVLSQVPPHRRIVKLHEIYQDTSEVVLVLELIGGGELFEHIIKSENCDPSEFESRRILKQLLEAVKHLHKMSLVHLDIKPENILLVTKEAGSDIKLVDFGLAKWLRDGEVIRDMVGTPEFVAPEVINFEAITRCADMWSIGVLTYILLTGVSPFLGDSVQETYNNICQVSFTFDDELFSEVSEGAKDFISRLLVFNPTQRLTVEESLNHSWISSMLDSSVDSEASPTRSSGKTKEDRPRSLYRRSECQLNAPIIAQTIPT